MKLKRILGMCLVFSTMLTTSACADLGDAVGNEKEYGDLWNISLIDSTKEGYPMSDFYNEDAINDYKCAMDYSQYRYFAVSPNENVTLEDFYFVIYADKDITLEYKVYMGSTLPTKFSNVSQSYQNLINYKNGTDESYIKVESDEPYGNEISSGSVKLTKDIGKDISIRYGSKRTNLDKNQYLLVQFTNNSDAAFSFDGTEDLETLKEMAEARERNRVNLKFTCLLIESDLRK